MECDDKDTREEGETAVLVRRLLHDVDRRVADAWAPVCAAPDAFLHAVFAQAASVLWASAERDADAAAWTAGTAAVRLLVRVYTSLDCVPLRRAALRLVSAPLWTGGRVPARATSATLRAHPHVARMVAAAERRFGTAPGDVPERDALHTLVCAFLAVLERLPGGGDGDGAAVAQVAVAPVRYCAAVLALLCTLLCQLPTRRFVHTYLAAGMQLMPRLRLAPLASAAAAEAKDAAALPCVRALRRLAARYAHYDAFPVDDATGAALDAAALAQAQSRAVAALQAAAHRQHPAALRALVLASAAACATPESLAALLRPLPDAACRALAVALGLLPPHPRPGTRDDTPLARSRAFVVAVLAEPCRTRAVDIAQAAAALPLFPTEAGLWDPDLLACERDLEDDDDDDDDEEGDGGESDAALALPRLTLQYLAPRDYLERTFRLLALDAAAAARADVEAAVKHMQAAFPEGQGSGSGSAPVFEGAWRMALPVGDVRVVRVAAARLGEAVPAGAVLELGVALGACADAAWRAEWDALRPRDVLFLVALRAGPATRARADACDPAHFDPRERGVVAVRGCEVLDIRDDAGTVVCGGADNDDDDDDGGDGDGDGDGNKGKSDSAGEVRGTHRRFRVLLDGAQYALDNSPEGAAQQLYAGFSLVVRRRPEQSNFRAVLQTLRGLMHGPLPLPDWLAEPLLGFVGGSTGSTNSSGSKDDDSMTDEAAAATTEVDMGDTFLSREHLAACHPGIAVTGDTDEPLNYRIALDAHGTARAATAYHVPAEAQGTLRNRVPFTPAQVRALEAGMREGLTLVAGAPGTGKGVLAAQLVACLCRAHPAERVLLVARTNHTLDRVVRRVLALGVDPAHVMRLGHGATQQSQQQQPQQQQQGPDLSRRGRVDAALARRLVALALAGAVARAVGAAPAEAELVASSCELAGIFRTARLAPLWAQYVAACARQHHEDSSSSNSSGGAAAFVAEHFPLKGFVAYVREWQKSSSSSSSSSSEWTWLRMVPRGEFVGDYAADVALAQAWWAAVGAVFDELAALRVLELVRSGRARADHLLRRATRVVALTSTHAALRHAALRALGLRAATLVVADAAQLLEPEALVPAVVAAHHPLRRVVLVGDPAQVPPAPAARALRARAGLDASLFARLLALGAPHSVLAAQGACRPSIAEAFAFACEGGAGGTLETLPCVAAMGGTEATWGPNAGFAVACQAVDVGDHQGRGETRPVAHARQNLGEAEAVVHAYMYMRLCGHARGAVALLTPHAAQAALLRDVVARRCGATPALAARYGAPAHVATVDQFQGRRADYVLLSLVRTADVGALADPRRLVQALSRARRGLYVFCRAALFAACPATAPFLRVLARHGTALLLCPHEHVPLPPSSSDADTEEARVQAATPVHSLVELAQLVHTLEKQQEQQQQQQQQ